MRHVVFWVPEADEKLQAIITAANAAADLIRVVRECTKYVRVYPIPKRSAFKMMDILMFRPEDYARCLFQRSPLQTRFRVAAANWSAGNS
jgi:hypothetical protein